MQCPAVTDVLLLNTEYLSRINLAGLGIGDGWMSPYHNARYGKFLYQVRMSVNS